MTKLNLENIGNLGDYEHEPRLAAPVGLVTDPALILKFYTMFKEAKGPIIDSIINNAKKFLQEQIKNRKINPLTGLGFAILSEDILNVARWDVGGVVLRNQLYGYEMNDSPYKPISYFNLDINEDSAFCIWELGIVHHERGAWKKYLQSNRIEKDKKRYLSDTIIGRL